MKAAYINPFLKSTCYILEQFQLNHKVGKPELRRTPSLSKNILVMVGITGELSGQIFFGLDENISLEIVSRMMGGVELSELDEMTQSGISELGNMICGNAVTIFSNENIKLDITPPTLILGKKLEVNALKINMLNVPIFIEDMGYIDVNVALEEKKVS